MRRFVRPSARTLFQIAAVATVVGVAAVAGYGWNALADASAAASRMSEQLMRLASIERAEEQLHALAATSPGADAEALVREIARVRSLSGGVEEAATFELLDARIAVARSTGSAEDWSRAAEVVSRLEKRAISLATGSLRGGELRTSARDILRLGAAVVLLFGASTAVAFARLRRERREAEAVLRRSDRLAALGTMAASVAHELNNPLATISGCATAVRDRLRRAPEGHADSLEYLGMIVDETRRCGGIVRSLGDLARDGPPAMAPSDVAALAREVVGLVGMAHERRGVEVTVSGEPSVEIVCDPDKIKQVLLNLFVNAQDACGGRGRVTIGVTRTAADGARIVVEDDGQGIAPADLPRIFEPFHTGKARGLGLGLFVCERVTSLHGGTIAAESRGPGRGAKFTVTLPARPPDRLTRGREDAPSPPPARPAASA